MEVFATTLQNVFIRLPVPDDGPIAALLNWPGVAEVVVKFNHGGTIIYRKEI